MSKYSFTGNSTGAIVDNSKPCTQGQIQFYLNMCAQKHLEPQDNYLTLSFNEMRELLDKTKNYFPASQTQLELINQKVEILAKAGVNVNIEFDKLTGGREGTASKIINKLIELEKANVKIPPSEGQLRLLVSMYPCPDCNFETFGIPLFHYIEDTKIRLTPDEFADEICKVFDKTEASQFIDYNMTAFNEWKKTRIRPNQLSYLKTLLERCEQQIDEVELLMMSIETASELIDRLVKETKERPATSITEKSLGFEDLPMNIVTIEQAQEIEDNKLRDAIFSIISQTGYEPDNIDEICAGGDELRDYLLFLVSDENEHLISVEDIINTIGDSAILQEAFASMLEERKIS